MDVLIFGDQTADVQSFLRKALGKQNPLLQSFFQRTCAMLQDEVANLTYRARSQIPIFSDLARLVDDYYRGEIRTTSLESAFTCLAQLAHFIGFFEESTRSYLEPGTPIVGLCTGILSAAAVSCCNSLVALIPLAIEAVRLAFRLGAQVGYKADGLEQTKGRQKSWSTIVTGLESSVITAEIDAFNQARGIQYQGKLYISSVANNATTVSGPPTTRRRLFEESTLLRSSNHRDLSVYGPYHAPHLYSDETDILSEKAVSIISTYSQIHKLCYSQKPVFPNAVDLFDDCIHQILEVEVNWDSQTAACSADILECGTSACCILAMGPTTLGNSLASSLKGIVSRGFRLTLEDHFSWLFGNKLPSCLGSNLAGCNIAVIGMACRLPNAADHEAFWELLSNGLDVHRKIPPDRFDAEAHTDPSGNGKNKSITPYGCFIEQPGLFDPRFFNMSPREARQTDPMQRLAITTVYEAMESSGFVINRTPSTQAHRIGTFYGQTSDDWREINAAEDIDTYFITGGVRAFGPGRINYHFGFSGPSFSIDTACSSSFAAIQLACTSLRAGDCDTVFAGGMNVLTNPDIFAGLSKGQFLSKTGSCKTFDNDADGYCRGDGVATVILKRIEDAITDNDPILAIIRGTATNHSAEAISLVHPHVGAQQYLFQKIMDNVGVDPRDVNYVEMHGTGTQAGDAVEIESVTNVFAPRHHIRNNQQLLYIGSAKANIGHGEAVSGVSSLIKVILMFQKNMIPPHCGIKNTINRSFPSDLKQRGVRIASIPTAFPKMANGKNRLVFVNNFSAAGGNSAVLVEDAPNREVITETDPRSTYVVTISAKSLTSFWKNARRLLLWMDRTSSTELSSLSYTTTARRQHYNYRLAFAVENMGTLYRILSTYLDAGQPPRPVSNTPPAIAFVFTGQGSQYTGMAKSLFTESELFRKEIQHLDRIATSQGFPSILALIDGTSDHISSESSVISQLCMTCIQIALANVWRSWGLIPSVVIGHSLGEYAALHAAGVLSVFDTIYLVGKRAQLLETECSMHTHCMLAVKGPLNLEDLITICNSYPVEIACLNSPQETVLSGSLAAIDSATNALLASRRNLKCTKLDVPFAFHSAHVGPILDQLEKSAKGVVFHPPQLQVLSSALGDVVKRADVFGPGYLGRHARGKVNFLGALRAGLSSNTIDQQTVWVEIGPHPVCSAAIKGTIGRDVTTVPSLVRTEDACKTTATSLATLYRAGVSINWSEYHRSFEKSLHVLSLPTYAFDEKTYWLDYTNNWALTKGEVTSTASAERVKTKSKISTTTVQRLVQETIEDKCVFILAESDLHDPLLKAVISGHRVNGVSLCPSSINADIALTICHYAYRLIRPNDKEEPIMDVCDMESHRPLILDLSATTQILQIKARYDESQGRAEVHFQSRPNEGRSATEYGRCTVKFEDRSKCRSGFSRSAHLVNARVNSMLKFEEGLHTIYRGMAYKLFAALVDYDYKFRGMEEVRLNSENLEATARIRFKVTTDDGNFFFNPYFIDSVAHVSGFVMNANDAVDSASQVYISHGWDSMKFIKKLHGEKEYRSYVRMVPVSEGSKIVAGDVYILDGRDIVGIIGGVRFQCIPRKLMSTLLPNKISTAIDIAVPTCKATVPSTWPTSQSQYKEELTLDTQKPAAPTPRRQLSIISRALEIVASELGCPLTELDSNTSFTNLGIDSLMSLSISSRFREELNISVEVSLFMDIGSIRELEIYISQFAYSDNSEANNEGWLSESAGMISMSTTEPSEHDFQSDDERAGGVDNDVISVILSTIAEEMDIEIQEIGDTVDLSTMGMDSLMSLTILSSLKERTAIPFASDFLTENTTIEQIKKVLGQIKERERPIPKQKRETQQAHVLIPESLVPRPAMIRISDDDLSLYPHAPCINLSGNPRTATRNLFLLPDGSGAASSYVSIPELDEKTAVFALNCPFMRTPELFTIGVPKVTQIYMKAIRQRQPHGPYLLGGWSAGGVIAFEMTRQLIAQGETVARLILIDSPNPLGLEALPPVFHEFCRKIGLLGDRDGKTPKWLLPHFQATVRELTAYSDLLALMPVDTCKMPRTAIIWARDGVVKDQSGPRPDWDERTPMPNSMEWLCNNRIDLGANGWQILLGEGNVQCVSMEGNHFTVMKEPLVKEVGRLIKEALDMNLTV